MSILPFEITRRVLIGGIGSVAIAKVASIRSERSRNERSKASGQSAMRPLGKVTKKDPSQLLFTDLMNTSIPPKQTEIRTVGYAKPGVGAGLYRCDTWSEENGQNHPMLCPVTGNNRRFMLVPENGAITVEQAGALGDSGFGLGDDREAFQAAIDYARALQLERLNLSLPAYAIWMTKRYTPAFMMGNDGNGLIIAADQRLEIVGLRSDKSRIRFLGPNGETFADIFAVQSVYGQSWRGSGFAIRTGLGISALSLRNLRIETDYRRNPDGPESDLAWDVTNKGILTEPDKPGGDISIVDCDFVGWRGETVYCNNDPTRLLYVRNSTFSHSNGQGLNPNCIGVDVADCLISNCRFGIEGWTGEAGGRISATIEDCGAAFSLQGGTAGVSSRSSFAAPTKISDQIPTGEIDLVCRNSGRACIGWWLTGSLKLIDSNLSIGDPGAYGEGTQWLDLDISLENLTDKAYVYIAGGLGDKGDMLTDNLDLRIAVTGSKKVQLIWYGSLGPDVQVRAGSSGGMLILKPGNVLDHNPRFE